MLSSTFNSETGPPSPGTRVSRAAVALLACAVALLLCIEGGARFGLERVSRIHRRIREEAAETRNLTQPAQGGRKRILFVGNSLLLEGVDMNLLSAGLQSQYETHRYVVEQTSYLDWLYGLKAVFRNGTRADSIVLCLNAPQLMSPAIRGDFSARMLFDVQDIWPAAHDSGADLTKVSGYYLAHFSEFYAMRAELRSVLMFRLAPPVAAMWHDSVTRRAMIPPDDQMVPVMAARFRQLNEVCRRYGAGFIFLDPPDRQSGDTAMLRAGEQSGVRVLRPIPNKSLSLDYYQDGFHLNRKGAALFTTGIVHELLR
jgi:hypothetical protein